MLGEPEYGALKGVFLSEILSARLVAKETMSGTKPKLRTQV